MNAMTREELLDAAKLIVTGDREDDYGTPENSFAEIAVLWNTYLETYISSEDVAVMMMLLKVARLKHSRHRSVDSWVDIAGYAACGAEIATRGNTDEDKKEIKKRD